MILTNQVWKGGSPNLNKMKIGKNSNMPQKDIEEINQTLRNKTEATLWEMKYFKEISLEVGDSGEASKGSTIIIFTSNLTQKKN